ncbi:MAG: ATP synthase F1 subunit gamma [Holosporales bacterium]|jgi:F-type H+-transporting ATPase subunit gamma|nr:ATP synthase F1 subunit gamma [Holosporales bacterium]
MANLKDIKNRIRGVSSTHKITSAMKLIATAKLRHSMEAVALIRDYEDTLVSAINWSGIDLRKEKIEGIAEFPWYLTKEKKKKPHVFFVLGANRGLCGSYNSMIIRETLALARKLGQDRDVLFIPLTLKSSEYFLKNEFDRTKPLPGLGFSNKHDYMATASYVVDQTMHWLEGKEIGSVSVVFGKFVNALVQKVEHFQLFPFFRSIADDRSAEEGRAGGRKGILVEPSFVSLTKSVVNSLARVKVCRAFVESDTCEQAARMTMMDSAKRNAENLIDKLTLQYNRTRQANITNELIEIVSGTNAMLQE